MLPYLEPKKTSSIVSVLRKSDSNGEEKDEPTNPALMAAAEDILKAIDMKDAKALATALEAAYMECGSDNDMGMSEDSDE